MTRIPESELILNDDQTIYHLKLAPEDIPDTIITVGDPDRVTRVSQYFDTVDKKTENREIYCHIGTLNKKPIMVISTGMGVGTIDIVINELDALVNIDLETRTVKPKEQQRQLNIIRLGTAGGLQPDLELNSLVVTDFAIGLDELLNFYKPDYTQDETELADAIQQHLQHAFPKSNPYAIKGSSELINLFPECYHGITLTCPGFYAPQGRVIRATPRHEQFAKDISSFRHNNYGVTNFEMETAAIYGMSKVLNHRCCSISAAIANRLTNKFSDKIDVVIDDMIKYALEKISNFETEKNNKSELAHS